MRSIGAVVGAVLLVLVSGSLSAQTKGVPMQVLQTVDTAAKGHVAITAIADWAPQHTTGWHTHPGEMVGYIVSGSVRLEQDGRAPRMLNTGDSFIIPAGVPHTHTNISAAAAKMFVTYYVVKDRAISAPVLGR
jgi:quercetin dioxygenase-like cupin family protein